MIDLSDPITVIVVFVPIIAVIIASLYYINKFIQDKKDREIKIHVTRFIEPNSNIHKIRARYMNKPIERCNVSFKGTKLFWDGADGKFDFTIFEGVARNLTIPQDIFSENAEVVIKSNNRILLHKKFRELEEGSP